MRVWVMARVETVTHLDAPDFDGELVFGDADVLGLDVHGDVRTLSADHWGDQRIYEG